uniref:Uncharacterized protein n=1 Tax=Iconisemion striatum TaxID=60296 RepID=A0A1A7X6X4_9TELE
MALDSANGCHAAIHAGSIVLAFITQIISGIFFVLAQERCVPNALFQTSSRNVSESFPLEVTMDWWSETYWVLIDLWSKAWLIYAVVGIFKSFILSAVVFRWVLPVYSFGMLYISYSNLSKHKPWLAINNPSVIPWTRYLTQNGLAGFAWWSLLHAVVGLGLVLKYYAFVEDPLVSTMVLAIIFLCIISWFILQTFFYSKHMRHTFSVYAVLILGLGAMFTNSYRVQNLSMNTAICGGGTTQETRRL